MITFHIITIFPHILDSYLNESILKRAQKKGIIKINIYNLRDFTSDPHRKVDDKSFGGGPGMVIRVEPIYKAIEAIKKIKRLSNKKRKVILFTPHGKKFNQKIAYSLSGLNELILICGRYEGVDERVAKYIADEEISIGEYVLSGGELPAMVVIEAVSRLIPEVLGNIESIEERRIQKIQAIDNKQQATGGYSVYTRPAVFESGNGVKWKVPKVLLSGNHKKIIDWRLKHIKMAR